MNHHLSLLLCACTALLWGCTRGNRPDPLVDDTYLMVQSSENSESVFDILARAHHALGAAMDDGPQIRLTMLSDYQVTLADMELDYLRTAIENSFFYSYGDDTAQPLTRAEFDADWADWEQRRAAYIAAPSEYEGGSLAAMDKCQGLYTLICEEIALLRAKYPITWK